MVSCVNCGMGLKGVMIYVQGGAHCPPCASQLEEPRLNLIRSLPDEIEDWEAPLGWQWVGTRYFRNDPTGRAFANFCFENDACISE